MSLTITNLYRGLQSNSNEIHTLFQSYIQLLNIVEFCMLNSILVLQKYVSFVQNM